MKILFIGGTGRLSRDSVTYAIEQGHDVYVLNRGTKEKKKHMDDRCKWIAANIREKEKTRELLSGQFFDVIIDFLSYNVEQMEITLSILDGHYKQYIFISSATVYDKKNEDEIISEDKTLVGNTKWKYAKNKVECEQFLVQWWSQNKYSERGLYYTIVRPYVTYGIDRFPYALVPRSGGTYDYSLLWRIRQKKPIPLYDGGNVMGTIMHTRDFAYYLVGLFGNRGAYNQDFHLTSDEELRWGDVLRLIIKAAGNEVVLVDIPSSFIEETLSEYTGVLSGDKATNMLFDNAKIKKVVGSKESFVRFEDGIKETVAFYDSNSTNGRINYFWDGRMDYLIKKYCRQEHIDLNNMNIKCCAANFHDRILYYCGRWQLLNKLYEIEKRIKVATKMITARIIAKCRR